MTVRVLRAAYDRPETDLEALAALREEERPDFLLMDSYFMRESDFALRRNRLPGLPMGYLDDLAECDPPVELLVNYSAKPPVDFYRNASLRLLGPGYAPLRKQFAAVGEGYVTGECVERILLTTGGTDPCRMAERIIRAVRRKPSLEKVRIEVVAPTLNDAGRPDSGALEEPAETGGLPMRGVNRHRHVTEMAALMASCDLAVSAGGTTLYELCAVGVPTAAFSMADNQRRFAGQLAEIGVVELLGDVREEGQAALVAEKLTDWLLRMTADPAGRRERSAVMRRLTDGRGAERIAGAVLSAADGERCLTAADVAEPPGGNLP